MSEMLPPPTMIPLQRGSQCPQMRALDLKPSTPLFPKTLEERSGCRQDLIQSGNLNDVRIENGTGNGAESANFRGAVSGWVACLKHSLQAGEVRPGVDSILLILFQAGMMFDQTVWNCRRVLSVFIIGVCSLQGAGCSSPPPPVVELPPPEVAVTAPVELETADYLEFTGRTEPIEEVEIRAQVTGYILNVPFEEGEEVAAGDLLFEIDPRPYVATVKAAEADLARAEAELKKASADAERDRLAFEKAAISEQERDMSAAMEAIATASVAAAKAALENANLDVEFTTIKAPVSGRVGRALITKGNLISANQLDSTLTTVVSVKPIDVYFDIDERSLLRLSRRMREKNPELRSETVREAAVEVGIQLADEDDFPHKGLLDFADNRIDPDTGTIRVRARFPNEDEFLHPGMFVRVQLPVGDPRTRLLIPERAIGTDQGQRYVLVVKEDNSTERKNVTLGVRHTGGMRVIQDGLAAGDRVIAEGLQRVRVPAPVNPVVAKNEVAPEEEP